MSADAGDSTLLLDADVPGCVTQSLLNAGLIPDPYNGTHERDVQWVEQLPWTYSTTLARPQGWPAKDSLVLTFSNLDTDATVRLDGVTILTADNAHRTHCSQPFVLNKKEHELTVTLAPVAAEGQSLLEQSDFIIPASNEPKDIGFQTSPFTRKPGYQFGWDWGPRLAGPGIMGEVSLKSWNEGARFGATDPWCQVVDASPDRATLLIHDSEGWDLGLSLGGTAVEVEQHGDTLFVPSPALWWPRSHGPQPLYDVTWTKSNDGSTLRHRMGIRTAVWQHVPDSMGVSMELLVNGTRVFCRGANVVPPDFLEPYSREGWNGLVEDAVEANMNMLRVWGGGVYPPQSFFEACDEQGLLVWQDFMFACTMVPTDDDFAQNVRLEAEEQVLRLRHHPSLVLWCGNNEAEKAWHAWGWQDLYDLHGSDSVEVIQAYHRMFDTMLPQVVHQGCDLEFLPTSPTLDPSSGDAHAWGIWFGKETMDYYSRHEGRFASEYGLQSLPERRTLASAGVEGFQDEALQFRQRSTMDWLEPGFDGWDMMAHYMDAITGLPSEDNLDDWVFRSQVMQAVGLREALERHRTSAGRYGGSLFWSLNDVWPAVSWSTVDHAGRWKLGQHAARRANQSRTVLWKRAHETRFQLVAFNDLDIPWQDTLTVTTCLLDGKVLHQAERVFSVAPRSETVLDLGVMKDWQSHPSASYWLWETAEDFGCGTWTHPKSMDLQNPQIDVHIDGHDVTLVSDVFVPVVQLTADSSIAFQDNGFALLPAKPHVVRSTGQGAVTTVVARHLQSPNMKDIEGGRRTHLN